MGVLKKFFTGVTHRIVSSIARGISEGSFLSFSNSLGFSIKARIPPAVEEEVVSCPAVAIIV